PRGCGEAGILQGERQGLGGARRETSPLDGELVDGELRQGRRAGSVGRPSCDADVETPDRTAVHDNAGGRLVIGGGVVGDNLLGTAVGNRQRERGLSLCWYAQSANREK